MAGTNPRRRVSWGSQDTCYRYPEVVGSPRAGEDGASHCDGGALSSQRKLRKPHSPYVRRKPATAALAAAQAAAAHTSPGVWSGVALSPATALRPPLRHDSRRVGSTSENWSPMAPPNENWSPLMSPMAPPHASPAPSPTPGAAAASAQAHHASASLGDRPEAGLRAGRGRGRLADLDMD